MTPEQVLDHAPRVLTQAQRQHYFAHGYVCVESLVPAGAKPYSPHPQPTRNTYKIVRGEAVRWAHHDPRPCQIPPDWSGGYTSIYAAQAGEDQLAT